MIAIFGAREAKTKFPYGCLDFCIEGYFCEIDTGTRVLKIDL